MVKKVIVTFEYDPELESVKNVECVVDGVEKKKRTTKKKESSKDESPDPRITLESNKLVFNSKAVELMELESGDRIIVKWEKLDSKKIVFPTIGTDLAFDNEGAGNILSKSYTVAYRGNQNTVLAEIGNEFTIEPHNGDIWKMVSVDKPEAVKSIADAIKSVEKVTDPDIITEEDENIPIDELKFNFNIN